jgi:hypothetical protein
MALLTAMHVIHCAAEEDHASIIPDRIQRPYLEFFPTCNKPAEAVLLGHAAAGVADTNAKTSPESPVASSSRDMCLLPQPVEQASCSVREEIKPPVSAEADVDLPHSRRAGTTAPKPMPRG